VKRSAADRGRPESLVSRSGRRRGRVSVKRRTLRYPEEAKTTSAKTVAAQGTWWPVKPSQRVTAIGNTYSGVSRGSSLVDSRTYRDSIHCGVSAT
jgi:hypothetical protein